MLGYTHPTPSPVHAGIHAPPPAATAADGRYPTGMHSCFSPISGSKASVRYYVKDGQLSNVRHTWIYFTFMVDEEAAPFIEKADLKHGATYSDHEVLLFTRGNDEDDDEPRIGKYTSGKISRKRKDFSWGFLPSFYRPQRSCSKVIFLHLSVILFTGGVHGQEGACMARRGACVTGEACVAGVCVWHAAPPPDTTRYGQWAGGTHPTGMHSCSKLISIIFGNHLILNFSDGQRVSRGEPIVGESKPSGSAGSRLLERSSWTSIITSQVTAIVCVCLIRYMPQLQAGWNNQLWDWMQMSTTSSSRLCSLCMIYPLNLLCAKSPITWKWKRKGKRGRRKLLWKKERNALLVPCEERSEHLKAHSHRAKAKILLMFEIFSLISFTCSWSFSLSLLLLLVWTGP